MQKYIRVGLFTLLISTSSFAGMFDALIGGVVKDIEETANIKRVDTNKVSKNDINKGDEDLKRAIQRFLRSGIKTEETAKEWVDYIVETKGVTVEEAHSYAQVGDWVKQEVYEVSEVKEWLKHGFSPTSGFIRGIRAAGYSPSEARRYIDLGIDKFDLSSVTYTDRKSEDDKNKVRNTALDKVKENKIADLNKLECEALLAQMIDKDGVSTCNYRELKWDDVKLCSLDLKKAWRENKFTPWQTKQWTEAGVYAPTQGIFDDIKRANGIGYVIYKKYPECYEKIIENNSDWQRDSASNIPKHWDSPNIAQKAFALGIKRQEAYEEWISTEWSQDEIKKWIKLGLSSPDEAKRLKKFGMTVDNAPDYAQAGVSLENLDQYQGMSLEEIQNEKAAEDKIYAEARKKAEKEKSDQISKIRKNIDVIKSGKKYSCGLMQLSYGNNLVTLYDGFYGALEDQLVYIDQTGISKKYIGNKYTVQIITDIKSAKKDLYNAVISKNNGFEMPVYCK